MGIIPNVSRATFADVKAGTNRSKLLTPSLAKVSALIVGGKKEEFSVNFTGYTSATLRGKYFQFDSSKGLRHAYFDHSGSTLEPTVSGRTGIKIDVEKSGKNLNAGFVCQKLKDFFNTDSLSDYLSDWTSGNTFNIEAKTYGARTDVSAGNSGFTVTKIRDGLPAAYSSFSITFDGSELGGDAIYCEDLAANLLYWFSVNNVPSTIAGTGYRKVRINLPSGVPVTAANWAIYFEAAVNADGTRTAVRAGNTVTVTSKVYGATSDTSGDFQNGNDVTMISSGLIGNLEKYSFTVPEDVSALNGKYFLATFGGVNYDLWFYGADPAPNSLGIPVVSDSATETPNQLADRTAAALNATGDFSAYSIGGYAYISNVENGVRSLAIAGTSGLAINRTKQGAGLKTLRREIAENVSELVGFISNYANDKIRLSASNPGTPSFTKNSTFFIRKTCHHIPLYAQNGFGCLVSPSHLICATHYAPAINSTIYFENPLGGHLSRTVAARTDSVGGGDICVLKLNTALPSNVIFARVFPVDFGGKIPNYNTRERFALFNIDKDGNGRVLNFSQIAGIYALTGKPFDATLSAAFLPPAYGDSGSAVFTYVKDTPVLLFTFLSMTSIYSIGQNFEELTAGYGPNISSKIIEINAAMNAQGSTEQLTVINLDEFDV